MSTERLVREALENSVKGLSLPEPEIEQLLATGRAARRRRVATVASLAVAAVLLLVLAGLSFAWAGRAGQALEPVPANPTTDASIGSVFTSELQKWIDALPPGAPPATPYWHDGVLYVNGVQIPAPYVAADIKVAGRTVLVGGYENEPQAAAPAQWMLVRGGRLEPLPVPAGTGDVGLSVDGRIAFWVVTHQLGTKQFFAWDADTNTALASRTVNGPQVELLGVDASGSGYWQTDQTDPVDPDVTRWDVRTNTVHATEIRYTPGTAGEKFDGFVPWLHPADAYRSPDGSKRVFTDSIPGDSPSDCCLDQVRVRPVGPADAVDPEDVSTLDLSQSFFDQAGLALGDGNGFWVWWESNESVLMTIDGDSNKYLVRCSATGKACERIADLGPDTSHTDSYSPDPIRNWGFARAPASP